MLGLVVDLAAESRGLVSGCLQFQGLATVPELHYRTPNVWQKFIGTALIEELGSGKYAPSIRQSVFYRAAIILLSAMSQ